MLNIFWLVRAFRPRLKHYKEPRDTITQVAMVAVTVTDLPSLWADVTGYLNGSTDCYASGETTMTCYKRPVRPVWTQPAKSFEWYHRPWA